MPTEEYDYHFLLLAPGLSGVWFLQAARQYWLRFQPIVTDDWSLLSLIPSQASVAVTLLAHPDTVTVLRRQLASLRGDIYLDMLVAEDLPMMEAVLNARAEAGRRFGWRDPHTEGVAGISQSARIE